MYVYNVDVVYEGIVMMMMMMIMMMIIMLCSQINCYISLSLEIKVNLKKIKSKKLFLRY